MRVNLTICLFTTLIAIVYCLKDLPNHARGGLAQKIHNKLLYDDNYLVGDFFTWDAPLDHFDSSNNKTFKQRYAVNTAYWNGTGPVFFEIGGEGTMGGAPGGYISYLGQQYNALLVQLEHRFYGESIPNDNVFTENYKYLSVEQALADLASFTDWFTIQYQTKNAPWFVFGGSYPGALASWYRTAYPDHSAGSLSSSGVTNCIIDYYGFDQQVSAAIGNSCSDQIKRINKAYEIKVSTTEGWSEVLSSFNCESDMWKEDFFYMIADSWSMADQYSQKSNLCNAIEAVGEDASDEVLMTAFSNWSNSFWGSDFCAGGFYNTEQLADHTRWESNSRSWRFQTCSQVSYFNTAPASGSLRSSIVNLEYHLKQCRYMFNVFDMFPKSIEMNERYGGDQPKATNVFYSDFSDDPWQRASVNYPISSSQPYFLTQCNGCGHCKDFSTPSDSEPDSLKRSRDEFEHYLSKWLNDAYSKTN